MAHVHSIVQLGARIFAARDLHRDGLEAALESVAGSGGVYLAIDVDGIDPAVAPGVILPAHGGLDYTQMLELIHGAAARAPLVGASFVEYVPDRDPSGNGARAIARLASNVIAAIGRQRGLCV